MQVSVQLLGDVELRKALRRFTPDLEKALRKEMATALKPIVNQARGFVPSQSPMSGWAGRSFSEAKFPTYKASIIKKGIGYSTTPSKMNKNGFRSMAAIENKSRVGAIYEGAGRNGNQGQPWVGPKGAAGHRYSHSVNPKAGEQFIKNLPPLYSSLKGRGRLIYRAWALNQGKAEGAVNKAIDTAFTQFRARAASTTFKRAA